MPRNQTPLKVVCFIDHLRIGGTQHFLQQITYGLAARGYMIAIVCFNDSYDQQVIATLREHGIEVRIIGRRALLTGYGLISTLIWLWRQRFEVAITLLFFSDVLGRLLARLGGIHRVITSIRSQNIQYSRLQRMLLRLTMPLADIVVLNGAHARTFAIQAEGARPEQIRIIPNGITEPQVMEAGDPPLRVMLGIPSNARLIGAVGRLSYEKGYDLLIAAQAYLSHTNNHLVLVGDGPAHEQLERQAQHQAIDHVVHFYGSQSNVIQLLQQFDLFVHPSRLEGMSNALLEAMMVGLPIVATSIDGNRELIEDGIHGWLVESENPQAMATAMLIALSDPAEATRRGNAARLRAQQQFSLQVMIDAWEQQIRAGKAL